MTISIDPGKNIDKIKYPFMKASVSGRRVWAADSPEIERALVLEMN